jgi:predicted RNase H-like nuclease (RuvC/YqgF family)
MKRTLVCACALAAGIRCAGPALAEICVYIDGEGHVTYSNVSEAPPKGAKKLRCFKEASSSQAQPEGAARPAPPRQGDQLRKVDEQTQKRRDDDRRRILEEELATEQRQLEAARNELTTQENTRLGDERNYQRYLERVQPYRDRVANHERNIEALRQELANMK